MKYYKTIKEQEEKKIGERDTTVKVRVPRSSLRDVVSEVVDPIHFVPQLPRMHTGAIPPSRHDVSIPI